jgi:hypothetical protein
MSATAAMADSTSDCQKGVAMIKAELEKKHPAPVLVTHTHYKRRLRACDLKTKKSGPPSAHGPKRRLENVCYSAAVRG